MAARTGRQLLQRFNGERFELFGGVLSSKTQ